MSIINTGEKGIPLKEIIERLGNKNYDLIKCRCKWKDDDGKEQDILFGVCSYANGVLTSLDGDSYSLEDLYIEWKECDTFLEVWEQGEIQC